MLRCRDVGAVDMMCYLNSPEHAAKMAATPPSATVRERMEAGGQREGAPRRLSYTTQEYVELMDKVGVDKSLIATARQWEYTENKPSSNLYYEEEDVYEWIKGAPGRMYGLAGYNPFDITGSIAKVEKAIKEWGFKGVYFQSHGYGLRVDDRRYYPLYETCARLDVPVAMQVGHSIELNPSEVGRPMALDLPALEFPKVIFIASHTGWPWWDELIAMVSKHRNVYMDCSAWPPSWWQPSFVREIDGRCRNKTLWGTGGAAGPVRAGEYFDQMDKLLKKDESKLLILRENAMRIYQL